MRRDSKTRRRLFSNAALIAVGAAILEPAGILGRPAPAPEAAKPVKKNEEVSPPEDLMREHGALNRVLLLYEEARTRLGAGRDFPPDVLRSAASLIRRFIEEYHEKLEEEHLFPRFEKAGKLVELVRVLRQQHEAGRRLTARIEQLSTLAAFRERGEREKLRESLHLFIRMYRPHEAREDTILFPAFHSIVSPREYDALGDRFESKERELFGEEGFERIVGEIADLEKKVGIYELAQFTPPRG